VADLKPWQALQPVPLVIERRPQERIQALFLMVALLAGSAIVFAITKLRDYLDGRRFLYLDLCNVRRQRNLEAALERLASLDELTGFLSQEGLRRAVVEQAKKFPGFIQLIIVVNIDHFSSINNSLGRAEGDRVLLHFSQLLKSSLHESVAIARVTGDEFSCAMIGTSESSLRSEVSSLCVKLNDVIIQSTDHKVNINASIGASFLRGSDVEEILYEANIACSVVKACGGRDFQFFGDDRGGTADYLALHRLNQELVAAIHDHRLQLYGQQAWQLTEAGTLPSSYIELLCRICDSCTGDPYWSEDFIRASQSAGSLLLFDRAILGLACKKIHQHWLRHEGMPGAAEIVYAVNITPDTLLANGFVQHIEVLSDTYSLDPHRICLEITEQAALRNLGEAISVVRKLKQIGFKVALDDFGTGMTSLSYLRDLPLDYVKIDKSFIRRLDADRSSLLVIEFVVALSKEIGFRTIAEGVENMPLLLRLQDMGISIAQGYVVTRPKPLLDGGDDWTFLESGASCLEKYLSDVV